MNKQINSPEQLQQNQNFEICEDEKEILLEEKKQKQPDINIEPQVVQKDEEFEIMNDKKIPNINSICFNQTQKLIGLCTEVGYRIYYTNSIFDEIRQFRIREGNDFEMKCGITTMSFLYDTLIVAIITDGTNKSFPCTNVYIMDEKYNKIIKHYEFYQQIEQIQYMREFLLIASKEKIILYNIKEEKPLRYIIDVEQPAFFNANSNYDFFSYAYKIQNQKGKVNLVKAHSNDIMIINYNADESLNQSSIQLVQNLGNYEVANFSISYDSTRIALVEQGGKRVKIFDLETMKLLKILNRGRSEKQIRQLQFSKDNRFLALISSNIVYNEKNQNTLHVFDLEDKKLSTSKRKYKFNEWKQNIKIENQQQNGNSSKLKMLNNKESYLILFNEEITNISIISASDFLLNFELNINQQNFEMQCIAPDTQKNDWI